MVNSEVKDMYPLVSVAIPVYNGANYVRDAIDSVLAQTYPNFEVLVINDGSRDGGSTEEIALSYGDRVRYFSKSNGGVASALNLALKEAKGDYFCWLSHDDLYLPDKVAREMEVLLSLSDSNSVVFCRYSIIDSSGKYLYDAPEPPQFSLNQAAYQLILKQWLHCCTILAPKDLYIENGGFREDLPTTQDYDLLVKIGLKHPFIEIPEILLKARSHPEQGSLTPGHLKEVEHFFEEHIPLLSPEYMYDNFTEQEGINAFLALGKQMCDLKFPHAVLTVAKQLLYCEKQRANPEVLWNAIHQLTINYYPIACYQPLTTKENQDLTPPYAENKVKILARRFLPAKAWNGIRKLRDRLQLSLLPNHEIKQTNQETRVASLDFDNIYQNNGFAGTESRSGEGSSLFQTRIIREEIPKLLQELGIKNLLDVPCGDWNWMRHVDITNINYIGGDIVKAIIDKNNQLYGKENCKFEYVNIITGSLPKSDIILCRDCLVHLNFQDGLAAIEQFKKSGAKWLLTTTFTDRDINTDLYEGHIWRPLNLEKPPYNLPEAQMYINEGCTEGSSLFRDKCLGLWQLN
jgi:glycosyltransferase involved in cell wall biosynthesis